VFPLHSCIELLFIFSYAHEAFIVVWICTHTLLANDPNNHILIPKITCFKQYVKVKWVRWSALLGMGIYIYIYKLVIHSKSLWIWTYMDGCNLFVRFIGVCSLDYIDKVKNAKLTISHLHNDDNVTSHKEQFVTLWKHSCWKSIFHSFDICQVWRVISKILCIILIMHMFHFWIHKLWNELLQRILT